MRRLALGLPVGLPVGLLCVAACRPDPGPSFYDTQEDFQADAGGGATDVLPGPDPYQAGERRLSVGAFYEGGRSDEVPIDNASAHVYLYESTARLEPTTERIEGRQADAVVHTGKPWLGFGVHWSAPRNLRTWKTLHVSLRSDKASFAAVKLELHSGSAASPQKAVLDAQTYGYRNDGKWYHLAIPLADAAAQRLDLGAVIAPFVLIAGDGASGETLLLDNLYFTED